MLNGWLWLILGGNYQLINGGPAREILAQCGMENASGSAWAIDQKGIHFPGKAEDAVGVKEESLLQKVGWTWRWKEIGSQE